MSKSVNAKSSKLRSAIKTLVVYDSAYRNTEKIAKAMATLFPVRQK